MQVELIIFEEVKLQYWMTLFCCKHFFSRSRCFLDMHASLGGDTAQPDLSKLNQQLEDLHRMQEDQRAELAEKSTTIEKLVNVKLFENVKLVL